ncbi:MAG: peptidoglycan DD-metalloendopeptidase family protein [Bacillaceae bacterium]|nr:peptidoglycan DD-metalloendopeptidase family protein [Bacillaceae bacterium]
MKKEIWIFAGIISVLIVFSTVMFFAYSSSSAHDQTDQTNGHPQNVKEGEPPASISEKGEGEPKPEPEPKLALAFREVDGQSYISLNQLVDAFEGTLNYDAVNGLVEVAVGGDRFKMIKGAPVLERNGVYLPVRCQPLIEEEGKEIQVPITFVREGLGLETDVVSGENQVVIRDATIGTGTETSPVFKGTQDPVLPTMDAEAISSYLSFLSLPIKGAKISDKDSHLPGAPRSYRNGTHEGIDWYSGYVGVHVDQHTPVYSMADGVVVRADHDYREMTFEERDAFLREAAQRPRTPDYILDRMRGRQVWVQYDQGVMVRYVHLSDIPDDLKVGDRVTTDDIVGYVGNSGTSYGVEGNLIGLHLHSDILIYGEVFWKYLQPEEIRPVLKAVFNRAQ